VRVETTFPAETVQVFDGEHGWSKDQRGVRPFTDLDVHQVDTTLKRDTVAALLAAHEGSLKARLLPDVKDAAGVLHHALELSSTTLEPFVLYIDPQTNLIAKQAYVAGGPGQPLIEETYSDYRPVQGLQVAFSADLRRQGQRLVARRVTDFKINTVFDPSIFKRPGS
jgi:hypothetical protein